MDAVESAYPFPGKFYRERYEKIAKTVTETLPVGAKILDFGAGPCEITAILSHLGYKCTAYDDFQDEWLNRDGAKEKAFAFAKSFGVNIVEATSRKLPFEKESFDMFMLHDVLEHIYDSPRHLLNDGVECVKPNGYLFATLPSLVNLRKRLSVLRGETNLPGYALYYWYPKVYRGPMREYTKSDFKYLNEFLGLKMVRLENVHHMISRVPNHLRTLYKIGTAIIPDSKDSWSYVGQKPENWVPKRELDIEEWQESILKKTQRLHRKNEKLL